MKRFCIALLALLLGTPLLYAQQDTTFTTVKEETGTIEPQHYQTQYDQAFRTMIPAKWMFKWDMSKLIPVQYSGSTLSSDDFKIKVGVEHKISDALSLGADYTFATSYSAGYYGAGWASHHLVQANMRWYYNMSKKIKEGQNTSNFSGNYIGFQSGFSSGAHLGVPNITYNEWHFTARYGIQRRLLKRSFVDLSYGLGASFVPFSPGITTSGIWKFSTNQQFAIGLAHFSPKKQEIVSGGFCDVLRCFDEDKRMIKVDLFNVLKVNEFSEVTANITLAPSISIEQKLGSSPFSIEIGAGSNLYYNRFGSAGFVADGYRYRSVGGSVQGELRWYYSLQRRILTGKSGNNLSGPFLALNTEQSWGHARGSGGRIVPYTMDYKTTTAKLTWGFQQRVFDNAFIQFKAGILDTWTDRQYKNLDPAYYNDGGKSSYWSPFSELKVGLAF